MANRYFIAGLSVASALFSINLHADREFTATAQEHIPTAIQHIAQTTAKSLENAPSNPQETQETIDNSVSSEPKTQFSAEEVSEAFGHLIVKNLESPGFKFDINKVIQGMRDEMEGKPSPLTDEQYEQAVMTIQEEILGDLTEKNLKAANDFLEKNATAPGVVVLIPGKLQYKIDTEGSGAAVQPHSSPLIHYTGSFLDGTVFGSSKDLDEPITLPLDQTIAGFGKGLLGMKEGEKRTLFIHPDLGYGTMGQLPPNSLLIFEVELIKADTQEPTEQPKHPTDTDSAKNNSKQAQNSSQNRPYSNR